MHPSCRPERHNPYVLPLAPKHRRGRRPVPLIHAPRLRHLDLEPLGHVASFPPGFLSGSPQLRYLNLDATGVSSLQPDFLGRHPHLETVRLRAQNMTALPRCFLAQSPNLMDLKLGLQRVEALPEGWLAETPRLWNLEIDVHGIEALPAGFLAHAPRIRTLGLAMPLLEPTLTPEHRLWETLQATSLRVKVTRPDPVYFNYYDYFGHAHPECRGDGIKFGDILEVRGRAPDDHGRTLLTVIPWRERELFVTYWGRYCQYLVDAGFTAPTLEVCAVDWDPEECDPVRERYEDPFSFRG